MGRGEVDLAGAFKVALFLSTSNCGNKALAPAHYTDLTNEVANGNGYTTGGVSVGSGTYVNSSGLQTFDVNDASWTASGAGITARYAVLYTTGGTQQAVAYCVLDGTPADYVVAAGQSLTLLIPAVFTALATTAS